MNNNQHSAFGIARPAEIITEIPTAEVAIERLTRYLVNTCDCIDEDGTLAFDYSAEAALWGFDEDDDVELSLIRIILASPQYADWQANRRHS